MAHPAPAPAFVESLQAALVYWQGRLQEASPAELDAQRHNLYRAVQFGLRHPHTQAFAAEVATQAFSFVYGRGYWQEWRAILDEASDAALQLGLPARFWLLTRLGNLRRLTRDLPAALQAHEVALQVARESGERHLLAEGHYHLGHALRAARRYEEAHEQLHAGERFLAQLQGHDADRLAALLFNALGRVAQGAGRLPEAQVYLQQAVARAGECDDRVLPAHQWQDLGNVHRVSGDYDLALGCYERATDCLQGTSRRLELLRIGHDIGVLYFTRQDYVSAESAFRRVDMAFLHETGNLHLQALTLVSLGNALLYQARFDEAAQTLGESVVLWRQLGDDLELANAVGSLGEALAGLGDKEEARAHFEDALALLSGAADSARTRRLRTFFANEREKVAGQAQG